MQECATERWAKVGAACACGEGGPGVDKASYRAARTKVGTGSPLGGRLAHCSDTKSSGLMLSSNVRHQHLSGPCRFLEDVVKRLSAELARRIAADGGIASYTGYASDSAWGSGALAAAAATAGVAGIIGQGGPDGIALPPWMREPGFLNPLLAAYDQRVRSLEAEAEAKAQAVQAIEAQVGGGVGVFLVLGD